MFRYEDDVPREDEVRGSSQGILGDMGDLQNYGAAQTFLRATRLQRAVDTLKGKSIGFYAGVAATVLMIASFSILLYFLVENNSSERGYRAEKITAVHQGKFDQNPVNRSQTTVAMILDDRGNSVSTTAIPKVETTTATTTKIPIQNPIQVSKPAASSLLDERKLVDPVPTTQNSVRRRFETFNDSVEAQPNDDPNGNIKQTEAQLENGTIVPCEKSASTSFPEYRSYILQAVSPQEDSENDNKLVIVRNSKRTRHQRSTKNRRRKKNKTTPRPSCNPSQPHNDTSGVCPTCRFPKQLKLKENQTLTDAKDKISLLYEMERQKVTFKIVPCTEGRKGLDFQSFIGYVQFSRRCNQTIGPAYGRKAKELKVRLANLACEVLYHYPRNATLFQEPEVQTQQHLYHCKDNLDSLRSTLFNSTERLATAATVPNAGSV